MKRKIYQLAVLSVCSLLLTACFTTGKSQSVALQGKQPVTEEWLSDRGVQLQQTIQGTPFTLRQEGDTWIVTAPAHLAFNADRPDLLLPSALGPITRMAKMLQANPDTAALVIGHTDVNTNKRNYGLSTQRARAVGSIFRLGGLGNRQMNYLGVGDAHGLYGQQANGPQNNRVEIVIMEHTHLPYIASVYQPAHARQLALSGPR
ncbi:OmpA family protein [Denitrificimonas sp. JX-1]|uniref:OmpA family protein n=1 Tax=Denitrificimonas halotolerans TaxID=3098930 RepID=A0ABU5GR20_9GAMM|nr:OmpA family protein [Denitrificimonas sp. JX-1]MDY7218820.1 OmpA family protein [Denitrificimonas sp. JX-1]